jgi:hypothetical protein
MMKYRASATHLKAMKVFSKIAFGKIYGYEINNIPIWGDALKGWNDYAKDF